jgi:hypothetical protein
VELGDEAVDGQFPGGQYIQDLPPPGLGDCIERVRCGRSPGHASII